MSINFKPGTTPGETVEEGNITWVWDGEKWNRTTTENAQDLFLKKRGDNVEDATGTVNYSWNQDVNIELNDSKDFTFKSGNTFVQFDSEGVDQLYFDARVKAIDLTSFETTKFTSDKLTTIKSSGSDVILEASGAERVDRIIGSGDSIKQITNKEYVDNKDYQLQQDVFTLQEEIESIAPSSERGMWHYGAPSAATDSPDPGKFFLLSGATANNGGTGATITADYEQANAVVFHNYEWNSGDPTGPGSNLHTWTTIEVDELIDVLDRPDEDGVFGKILEVNTSDYTDAVLILFTPITAGGSPDNTATKETLLKIFAEPTGGSADEFVKKTGNADGHMTGDLTLNSTEDRGSYTPAASGISNIVFKNTTSSNQTSYINLYQGGTNPELICDQSFYAEGNLYLGFDQEIRGLSAGMQTDANIKFSSSYLVNRWGASDRIRIDNNSTQIRFGNDVKLQATNTDLTSKTQHTFDPGSTTSEAIDIKGRIKINGSRTNSRFLGTDNNGNTVWKTALTSQTQSDWNESNTASAAYINNKPTISSVSDTDFIKNGSTSVITITKSGSNFFIS
jgi:hypothetical protein